MDVSKKPISLTRIIPGITLILVSEVGF
jgi:hypothetical protein